MKIRFLVQMFLGALLSASLVVPVAAQLDYATITIRDEGDADGCEGDWVVTWIPQTVTSIEIRYRAMNALSVSPDVITAVFVHHGVNSSAFGWESVTSQVTVPTNTQWITATIIPSSTDKIDAFSMYVDDDAAGGTVGQVYGYDIDYIRIFDGATSWDFPLQDDGTRIWTHADACAYDSNVVASGTYGDVIQLDIEFDSVIDEYAPCNYYWEDSLGALTGDKFEWVWRAVPGDPINTVNTSVWVRQDDTHNFTWQQLTAYGWTGAGDPLAQQGVDWKAPQANLTPGIGYIGLSFDLSDAGAFSGTFDDIIDGVQVDTIAVINGATRTVVMDSNGPDPTKANIGAANMGFVNTLAAWDHLASFTVQPPSTSVRDWMLYQ